MQQMNRRNSYFQKNKKRKGFGGHNKKSGEAVYMLLFVLFGLHFHIKEVAAKPYQQGCWNYLIL